MAKPISAKGAEKKALKAMSDYVRKRDDYTCFTCGKQFDEYEDKNKVDCGHMFSRSHKAIKYNLKNVHAQCIRCNRYLTGNLHEYIRRFKERYGDEEYNKLYSLRNIPTKRSTAQFLALEKTFKELLKELESEKEWTPESLSQLF